ncbi:MAG: 4-hydroxy-tetrahydrodipicolinate synthase [Peptococcaceae bacterium]|jgi:4-hydroxy-tetrahydrodipicolinate synthase|nr:4-hydroxy-tetrahydrodipicolinate synthase [Peptococcaceae bacterium]
MGLGRVLTAMLTPMNELLEVDYDGVRLLAKHLVRHGSEGIVVCGTTGESPTLSVEEKLRLFEVVKDAVGSQANIFAGVGSNTTADSITLAKQAEKIGVDGVMAVVPYYNKPSQEGMIQHFAAIAKSISLPVMMYNVPGRTSVNMLPKTVQRLAEIENIVALKESCGNMDQISELKRLLPRDFIIYSGDDSMTLPMLSVGCDGIVSVAAHVIGDEIKLMVDAWFAGDVPAATAWHLKLFPMFKGIFVTTNPIPIKALAELENLPAGGLRLPLVRASRDEIDFLRGVLEEVKGEPEKRSS